MGFSEEDRQGIRFLRQNKKYGAKRLLSEFPDKGWTLGGLNNLLRKIDATGSERRQKGSGRPRTSRTEANMALIEQLLSERGDMVTSGPDRNRNSHRQIARQLGISHVLVSAMAKQLGRKEQKSAEQNKMNRTTRLKCARQLLDQYPSSLVNFVWFTGEKRFTVAPPSAAPNKDSVGDESVTAASQFVTVCAGVSGLGLTGMCIVEADTKINGTFYRRVLTAEESESILTMFEFCNDVRSAIARKNDYTEIYHNSEA